MSAVIGVNSSGDVIFCSEGKKTWHRPALPEHGIDEPSVKPGRDDVLKTIELNGSVCVAMAGHSDALFVLAKRLLPDLPWSDYDIWTPPFNFLETLEKPLSAMELGDAKDRICEIMTEALEGKDIGSKELVKSLVMIGGKEDGFPLLYRFFADQGKFTAKNEELVWAPPPARFFTPSAEFTAVDDVVIKVVSENCYGFSRIEEACSRAIEEYAAHSLVCNDNVMFRRLSRRFVLEDKNTVLGQA